MDIGSVFNEHKAVTYICQYSLETQGQCSQAMKQAGKQAFENNIYPHKSMKAFARDYL